MTLACNMTTFTPGLTNWWPPKLPDAILDYSLNITRAIDPATDFAVNAIVMIAPSGAGEMTASNLFITTEFLCGCQNTILTATMTGGQPGRTYVIEFDVTMSDSRVFAFQVTQNIQNVPGSVSSVPPSPGFGTPLMNTGGAGNPVIAYSGAIATPFEFVVMPNVGTWLDGVLTFSGPTIDYVGQPIQSGLTNLTITNAAGYLDSANGFTMTAAAMTLLSMPNMINWVGAFAPTMAALSTLTLTSLAYVNGVFSPVVNALATLTLPAILSLGGNFAPTAHALQTLSFGPGLRSVAGNVTVTGASLNVASVDGILVSLSLLNGTGFTTLWTGRTVDLSGGTSAPPSPVGLAAKVILLAAGNTVTTN